MKIVSLVPSLTEILFDFGLDGDQIAGRTKFCVHPKNSVEKIPIIGGTKNINIEKINALQPDLILANKEENVREQVEQLKDEIFLTQISTIEDNYYLLKTLGNKLGKKDAAQIFNLKIYELLDRFRNLGEQRKVAYLIWKKPWMSVGGDTFISAVLHELGFQNIFRDQKRYPAIQLDDLETAGIIMLSSEPYPFKDSDVASLQQVFPDKKIIKVNGEAFSWYGTRLAKMQDYFLTLKKELEAL